MSGGTISWLSKKQPSVILSTAEAEYVALSTATQEAVWLRRMLAELQLSKTRGSHSDHGGQYRGYSNCKEPSVT